MGVVISVLVVAAFIYVVSLFSKTPQGKKGWGNSYSSAPADGGWSYDSSDCGNSGGGDCGGD